LTELSLRFAAPLAQCKGRLLNVASLAAFMPGPGMAVYYASKAYVLSFSEALHQELSPRGIKVSTLCPGPVATEFQMRAGMRRDRPRILALPADRVAQIGYDGFVRGKRVIVAGNGNRLVVLLMRFLPNTVLLPLLDRANRGVAAAS
jgi:short-subunit dehydrogenase